MAHYRLFFDGSCAPINPSGTAAYGFALLADGSETPIETGSGVIGTGPGMTNNLAEFSALYEGLACFMESHWDKTPAVLNVFGDSNLVIQVMNGHWHPNKEKPYYSAFKLCEGIVPYMRKNGIEVYFDWIPREMNTLCDRLSRAH